MAKSERLAPAKDWRNRPVETWNVVSFTEYLKDRHRESFGIDYVPFGGGSMSEKWRREQGQIGRLIGTARKEGTHSKEVVKRWIDECFEDRTKWESKYPGINFGFMYAYRREILQRVEAEEKRRQASQDRAEEQESPDWDDLADWL